MAGGIVNFILRCIKKGSGIEEVTEDVAKSKKEMSEAKEKAVHFSKALMALGGVGNLAGRAVRSIVTGGLWEAGAELVKNAFSFAKEKWDEWKEFAKECANEAAKSMADHFSRAADRIVARFKDVGNAIKNAAKWAESFRRAQSAEDEFGAAELNSGIDSLTRQKLLEAENEEEKKVIQAKAELAKALEAEKLRVKKSTTEREALEDKISGAQQEYAEALIAQKKLLATARMLGNNYDWELQQGHEEGAKAIAEARKKVLTEYDAVHKRVLDLEDYFKIAYQERRELDAKINKAELEAHDAVDKAQFNYTEAVRKQTEEAEKRAKAESLAARKAEIGAQMREALSKTSDSAEQAVIKARAKLEQALLDAAEDEKDTKAKEAVDTARFELAEAIKNQEKEERKKEAKGLLDAEKEKQRQEAERHNQQIEKLLKEIADIEKEREKTNRGMGVDAQNKSWNPYQYHFDKDGKISFSDWQRTRRYGDETNDEAKARRRREQEDKRMEDLEKKWMSGQKLSDREQKKLWDWWDFQEEVNGKDKRQAQIEKLQKEAAEAAKKSEQHLKEMKEKLDDWIASGVMN